MKRLVLSAVLSLCFLSACGSKCETSPECPAQAPTAANENALALDAAQPNAQKSEIATKTPIPVGEGEIALPAPADVNVSLTQSLKKRRSIRAYTDEMISLEQLSALLWSANGVNREDKKRTAPSAMNKVSVSIYAAFEKGAYKYDALNNKLNLVTSEDVRPIKAAPLELILTSFYDNEVIRGIDTGVVSQNIALYCAATDLATVIRMYHAQRDAELMKQTSAALKLEPNDNLVFNMAIGFETK